MGAFTVFDFIIIAVVVISAIMSTGRGLIREATSVISFVAGFIVAGYTLTLFKKPLEDIMPDSWGTITPSAVLVLVGFLAAYILAAWLGGRVSKLLHASPEIGVLDRLGGAAFGVVRGALAGVLFVLLMQQVLPESNRPEAIVRGQTYGYLDTAAGWIRKIVPGFLPQAVDGNGKQRAPDAKSSGR